MIDDSTTKQRRNSDRTPTKFHFPNDAKITEVLGSHPFLNKTDAARILGVSEDAAERELRAMTGRGWLHMSAHRVDGAFVEFRWELS